VVGDQGGTHAGTQLRGTGSFKLAVWGMRLSMTGIAMEVVGLLSLVWTRSVAWLVLVGIGVFVLGDLLIVVGLTLVRRSLPEPRPRYKALVRIVRGDVFRSRRSVTRSVDALGLGTTRR
jgi:hypothetical protein